MRFKITGANAESGDDVDVMLEAPSQPDVEKIAHDKGILVASITVLENSHHNRLKENLEAIALVDDAPAAAPGSHAAPAHSTPVHAPHAPAAVPAPAAATTSAPAATPAPAANGHGPGDPHTGIHMEYHIMMNQSLYLLDSAVNRHLKEGWEPLGGVAIGVSNNAMQFFQALVRRPKS